MLRFSSCSLWTIVQDIGIAVSLSLGRQDNDSHPSGIGTVPFAYHPIPGYSLGAGLRKLHIFCATLVLVTLVPEVLKIMRTVRGNCGVYRIQYISRTTYGGIAHHLISNTGNTVLGLFLA